MELLSIPHPVTRGKVEQATLDLGILNLQEQLVRRNRRFQQTDAAIELREKLLELLNESGTSTSEIRREHLRSLAQQIERLKIPMGARIKMMLGLVSVRFILAQPIW